MGMATAMLNVDASHRGDEKLTRDHEEDLVDPTAEQADEPQDA